MYNKFGKKPKFVIVSIITTALMLLGTTATLAITTERTFAYENNQATSASNSCLNPLLDSRTFEIISNVGNCGNTVSQQAEEGQASSPTTLQIADPTIEVQAQQPEGPEPEPQPGPGPQTCEECFTAFLTDEQIADLEAEIVGIEPTIEALCEFLEMLAPEDQMIELDGIAGFLDTGLGLDGPTIAEIMACLENALDSA